jgi:hypothetical protein
VSKRGVLPLAVRTCGAKDTAMQRLMHKWRSFPKLIRFVAVNSVIAVLVGWAIAGALIVLDIGNFGSMIANSGNRPAALAILAMSFGSTFGFAYLATAVLLLPTEKGDFDRMS